MGLKKRRGLAVEIIWFIALIFVVGLLYVCLNPVMNAIISAGLELDVNPDVLSLLNTVWYYLPFIFIVAGIFFVIASVIWRQAEYRGV